MQSRIDLLRALEVFVAAAESGSMTAAARKLRITQSAVSQQLKLLETEMQASLIDRNTRPFRLTPAGQTLRLHAADMLIRADQVTAEVRQVASGPLAHLRIAMFGTLARTLAPPLVDAIVKKRLAVKSISLLRGMAVQHARDLPLREVDMVITSNAMIDLDGLERHALIHERFVLIVPKGAIPRHTPLSELSARLPMVRYSSRTEVGRLIEQHLRRLRLDMPEGHSFDAPEDLFSMIAMGQGWAITTPTHVVHAMTPGLPVELRALPKPGLGRDIVLVARKGELGKLPSTISGLCRSVLRKQYMARVRELMPLLSDHLLVVD